MRMIIDTDAGIDDAQAIMMALAHPDVTVEAITALSGNVHIDNVISNVHAILDLFDASVPVYGGARRPLLSDWQADPMAIHGQDGLGDWAGRQPTTRKPEAQPAALALIELANRYPGELTLVAIGPLTNIALAASLDPTFPGKIRQFTFMGGAVTARGNTRNITAEFNIFTDPEAAAITLHAFPMSRMVSWEATMAHPLPWPIYDELVAAPTPRGEFCSGTAEALARILRPSPVGGFLLPDPLAMAVTINPALILESETRYVSVELQGALTRGQTVVDYVGLGGQQPNVEIVTRIDMDGVFELYRQMLN